MTALEVISLIVVGVPVLMMIAVLIFTTTRQELTAFVVGFVVVAWMFAAMFLLIGVLEPMFWRLFDA